jgi:hypothetical protein
LSTEKTSTVAITVAATLDQLIEQTEYDEFVSFAALVRKAGLDPARDFVGASLVDIDFRGEDLRGFDFSGADLTGADFRRANLAGVRFDGAILTGAIGLPIGGPAEQGSQLEEYRKVQRAQPSGLRLSEAHASLVKGMLLRGDRQHDIAGWFGVNPGRIAEVKDGHLYPDVQPAAPQLLPPQVPPGPVAFKAMVALVEARHALDRDPELAKKIIDEVLVGPDKPGGLEWLFEYSGEGKRIRDHRHMDNQGE